jgi:transketolase
MRTAFIQQLIDEARSDDSVFLITGDLGFSVLEPFANEFPDRFLNAGVSEQNMTGIAAGLAKEGYKPFTYSIANFPTLRSMEQIRYDICYHELNVKIIAVGGGYAYGSLGASHHATEELGMLRTIPNLAVSAPGDPYEARGLTKIAVMHNGPMYIRIGKAGEKIVHEQNPLMEFGKALCVKKGKSTAVLSTGAMLKYANDFITEYKPDYSLYSFPFIKPIDEKLLYDIARSYDSIITIEEHQKSAGFGSAVLEVLCDGVEQRKLLSMPSVKRIAIPDMFFSVSGSQDYLRKKAGLELK